ncbi:AAWKG family protein [Streptomyces sp. NPDC047108]|uniref:AAWKG family protein n=1 Tax=Streptomyces sp. NPDC047108 TaxID=3155025 RepID=UPI0033F3E54A
MVEEKVHLASSPSVSSPSGPACDSWQLAVRLLTGYHMPVRDRIFDALIGDAGIPLMRVEISDHDGEPYNAVVDAARALEGWQSRGSGRRGENTAVVIPFYSGCAGPIGPAPHGTEVVMKNARITFLDAPEPSDDPHEGLPDGSAAGDMEHGGTEHPGTVPERSGDAAPGRPDSDAALAQYGQGGGMALERLLRSGTTHGFAWSGIAVDAPDAVSLDVFTGSASARDGALRFFRARQRDLENAQSDLRADAAARRVPPTGALRDLVNGLHRTCRRYGDALSEAGEPDTRWSHDLPRFRENLRAAAAGLHDSWSVWQEFNGDPQRWLHDLLMEVTQNVWLHNIARVGYDHGAGEHRGSPGPMTGRHTVTSPGFYGGDPAYGALEDPATWRRIGTTAVDRWRKSVDELLGRAGIRALQHLGDF